MIQVWFYNKKILFFGKKLALFCNFLTIPGLIIRHEYHFGRFKNLRNDTII